MCFASVAVALGKAGWKRREEVLPLGCHSPSQSFDVSRIIPVSETECSISKSGVYLHFGVSFGGQAERESQ